MSIEQVKVIIKDGRAGVSSTNRVGALEVVLPPTRFIVETRDFAKRQAKEQNLVFGEVNYDLIEQSRRARAKMVGGSS